MVWQWLSHRRYRRLKIALIATVVALWPVVARPLSLWPLPGPVQPPQGQPGLAATVAPGVTLWQYDLSGLSGPVLTTWLTELAPTLTLAPAGGRQDPVTGGNIPPLDGLALDVVATVDSVLAAAAETTVAPVFRRLSAVPTLTDLPPAPLWQGHPQRRQVTFLINVAWGNEHLPAILDLLAQHNVRTTFFLVGEWARDYPELARAIAAAGHEIANHGHVAAARGPGHLDEASLTRHITDAATAIASATGAATTFFSPHKGEISPHMAAVSQATGHQLVRWSLDTVDWQDPPPAVMVPRILDHLHGGALILMHPRAVTVAALPALLTGVAAAGYSVVPLSELVSPLPPPDLQPVPPLDYPGPAAAASIPTASRIEVKPSRAKASPTPRASSDGKPGPA